MELIHPECANARCPCFADKLRIWRADGHSPFATKNSEFYHGPTQREIVRDITDAARRDGTEIAPVNRAWV